MIFGWTMATGLHQNQEEEEEEWVPENLRDQLCLAVRSIQWSYAIFWSISTTQLGRVLEWDDGYYNGDIKTRKTIQAVEELNADQMGLQRSDQLKELYESLAAGETNSQTKRPSAALSPEDLTHTEWYYLVCMSFVFNIGQGLPGRTSEIGQPIWLCNAHIADSKVFTRSLLAKSASIQTVVCFPFSGGVVELGVTDLVLEDPSLIQHIKTSFLNKPYPIVSNNFISSMGKTRYNKDQACPKLLDDDDEILEANLNLVMECEGLIMDSTNNSSNGFCSAEDCFMIDGVNNGGDGGSQSQVQSWQIFDEEFSNCAHNSMNSSDRISQTVVDPDQKAVVAPIEKYSLQDLHHSKINSLDVRTNDLQYQNVLSSLLKSSDQLVLGPCFRNFNKESSFVGWKKEGSPGSIRPRSGTSQKLLKRVLFEVARMHSGCLLETQEVNGSDDGVLRPEVEGNDVNHVLSERRRREKLNERFIVLKSLVPSKSKVDKVSILDDTIEYLKELERRVEELETCRESTEVEATTTTKNKKIHDNVERTSDNYGKKPSINKRKACDIDETGPEINRVLRDNVFVSMTEKDVVIEVRCRWRESLLLEIMDALSNIHLDSHSVQSSTIDGILRITINSKLKGSTVVSAAVIRQALQRIVGTCSFSH